MPPLWQYRGEKGGFPLRQSEQGRPVILRRFLLPRRLPLRGLKEGGRWLPGSEMTIQDPQIKADLIQRLRRIEGQARGVARMIEDDRDCQEVLQQLAAIRAAVQQTSIQVMRSYTLECIQSASGSPAEIAEALIRAVSRFV